MEIFEDFLQPYQIQEIEEEASNRMPWFFKTASINPERPDTDYQAIKNGFDTIQLTHTVYDNGRPTSEYYDMALQIFKSFMNHNNMEYKALLRTKFNFVPRVCSPNLNQPPHVDYKFPHKVFLYYINNADGDTIMYNQFYNGNNPGNLTEFARVSPLAGRAVLFDGLRYHAPTPPSNSPYRMVLNIPFLD
jgi:hypothetical protein